MKGLYNKNNKTLKKETEENTRRWKDLSCSWISKIHTVTMDIYQIQCTPHQNSNDILPRNRKINPKIQQKYKKILTLQSNPEKQEQCLRYHNN
jgi:hypothetical protein